MCGVYVDPFYIHTLLNFAGIIYECTFTFAQDAALRCTNESWTERSDDIINYDDNSIMIMFDDQLDYDEAYSYLDSDAISDSTISNSLYFRLLNKVYIQRVVVMTIAGDFYGIEEWCVDEATSGVWYHQIQDSDASGICGRNQIHTTALCINQEMEDCGPVVQTSYFDINRPNVYIKNASWIGGIHTIGQDFIFVAEELNAPDAEIYCQREFGASLISIHNAIENEDAYELCVGNQNCWIGLQFSNSSSS